MADIKKIKSEAIATIDAALTILNKFPEFDEGNTNLSYNTSFNPFDFLMDLFKSTMGYDKFIQVISDIIVLELPAIEIAVKTVLITNFKNLISCTLNPLISDEVLLNGFTFNLEEVDILGILNYSPLAPKIGSFNLNPGKYFYFGCDKLEYPSELKRAGDFNAFLWYVKNISIGREVWTGVPEIQATFGDSVWGRGDYTTQKELPDDDDASFYNQDKNKCNQSAGILTLEFNERGSSIKDAEGHSDYNLKTPYNNCIHVFIGNTAPWNNIQINAWKGELEEIERQIEDLKSKLYEKQTFLDNIIKEYEEKTKDDVVKGKTDASEGKAMMEEFNEIKERTELEINEIKVQISQANEEKQSVQKNLYQYMRFNDSVRYRTIEQNYYYRRTIIEFNTDYIMSLKLFDSKVVAAQLIDALTACLSIDLNLSYEQLFIKNEIQKMVKMINETDDIVVNDCFFTFSNEEFNAMVQKSELIRAGLLSENGELNSDTHIDANSLLKKLNEINPDSSKEQISTVISGALTDISKTISTADYEINDKVNFNAQMNFIENLLSNLAYVITSAVVSPKLYLLLGINLQMLGSETNFDLAAFMEMHKQMIAAIIRAVRDALIQKLVEKLYKLVGYLAEEIGQKMSIEQILYYKDLLKKCIECFKLWGKDRYSEFDVNNIDYADILQDDTEDAETNKNC